MICSKCGKESNKIITQYYEGHIENMCSLCYNYYIINKGKDYPLPQIGTLNYTQDGKIICHICGKAFHKLGNHIYQTHNMTTKEYKKKFKINKKLTSDSYQNKMNKKSPEEIQKLIDKGYNTRFDQPLGNTPVLTDKIVRNRCTNCKYNNDYFCNKYNKNCKEIIKCKGAK